MGNGVGLADAYENFAKVIIPKFGLLAPDASLADWCVDHAIKLEGRLLDLEQRAWMRAVYDDNYHHVVLCKATQVGGSVWAMLRCVHLAHTKPNWRGTVYFFPSRSDVLDFSQTRVKPLVEENPILADAMGDIDKAGVRQIGDSYLYFRGMRTSIGMKSLPADCVAFDELDEATEAAKTMAKERLASSPYRYVLELSNPSIPQFGVDLAYSGNRDAGMPGSDQRGWHIKCKGCNNWTCMELEFPHLLGEEDLRVIRPRDGNYTSTLPGSWYRCCSKCGKELETRNGQWVRAVQDNSLAHGYRLSQLYSPTIDPASIAFDYKTTRYPHLFYNLKIGIAWVSSADKLNPSEVLACAGDHAMAPTDAGPCTMGVDQGSDLHVVISRWSEISDARKIVHIDKYKHKVPEDWLQLDELMKRYKVVRCVVDALPNQSLARAFAHRHKGKVYLNFYDAHRKGKPSWDENQWVVREDRTEAIDASRSVYRDDSSISVILPRATDEVQDYARHMAALTKKREEADDGSVRFVYVHTAPDHYAHAWVYDTLCWLGESAPASGSPSRERTIQSVPGGRTPPSKTGLVKITNPAHPNYDPRNR